MQVLCVISRRRRAVLMLHARITEFANLLEMMTSNVDVSWVGSVKLVKQVSHANILYVACSNCIVINVECGVFACITNHLTSLYTLLLIG